MEGLSIIIPCYNKLELTRESIASLKEIEDANIDFIIIDNGSTDGTPEFIKTLSGKFHHYLNQENLGLVRAFNLGASKGNGGIIVFMHNDVIIHDKNWPEKIRDFLNQKEDAGVVGFYGAKRLRKDGTFMGRGIVHSKLDAGNLSDNYTEVAVIDGLFMAMRKRVFEAVGGFDEEYSMHYYDKDISMKSHRNGFRNYVLNIPFTHKGAGTRSAFKNKTDAEIRDDMNKIFIEKWKNYLPLDVRTRSERIKDWVKKHV